MMVDEGSTHPRGVALYEELLWIHGIIRENLKAIQEVTAQIAAGAPAEQVQNDINELARTNVVWRLRVDCMRYCHLVHSHHHGEDVFFFPFLCQANPALQTVTEKLQADHLVVSEYLDRVEAASARIMKEDPARDELVAALSDLSDHLLTHLDFEEANLSPTLKRLKELPFG